MFFKNLYDSTKIFEALQSSQKVYPQTPEEWIEKINEKLVHIKELYKISTPEKFRNSYCPSEMVTSSNSGKGERIIYATLATMLKRAKYKRDMAEALKKIDLNMQGIFGYRISPEVGKELTEVGGRQLYGFAWSTTGEWYLIYMYVFTNNKQTPPPSITSISIGSLRVTPITLEDLVTGKWEGNYSKGTMAETIFLTLSRSIILTRERIARQLNKFDEVVNLFFPRDLGFYYGQSSESYKYMFEEFYS